MTRFASPHPVRILAALIVLSLPLGWIRDSWLSAAVAVPLALGLLLMPLWWALRRPTDAPQSGAAALRAGIVVLAALGVAARLGLGPDAAGWLLAAVAALLVLRPGPGLRRPGAPAMTALVLCVALVAIVLVRPLELTLSSDAPGHVAAVLDARESGSLQPPDVYPGAPAGSVDPRFGVLHGMYAMLGGWTGAGAANTLRWAALFFSPLWFVAHAFLLRRMGMGPRVALWTAFLFTLYAGGGRGFGLGAAAFPGSVAQSLCAFGLAGLIAAPSTRAALPALALIALSTLIHPFAWWSITVVTGLTALLLLLRRATRPRARQWLLWAVVSALAGAVVLAPRLLARGASAGGTHDELTEVVFVGAGLFFADPFWIFRWGGTASVLALPALVLLAALAPGWARREGNVVGIALAAPVWVISLDPLLAPPLWSVVSYLVVRLGRIVLTTWVWVSALEQGVQRLRSGGRAAVAGTVLVVVGLLGLQLEISVAWLNLRQPQVINAAGTERHLDELATALGRVEAPWLLAAPRIGYGLRARGGPRLVVTPAPHASPNDRDVLVRLARWRELHDPTLRDDELRARLDEFGDALLLVDGQTGQLHRGIHEYAYVPDRERALALRDRLRAIGVAELASGTDWTIFRLDGPMPMQFAPPASEAPSGPWFTVDEVRPQELSTAPGSTVGLILEFAATGATSLRPQRVFVRVEGDMPAPPGGLDAVSKLWRKLVTERSGRSEDRFGQWVVPADLVVPPSRWPDGRWTQEVRLRVPPWAEPGSYTIQTTVHDWTWHGRHELRDYLSDTDRFSGPVRATLQVAD